MKNSFARILQGSAILILVMVLGLLPFQAQASRLPEDVPTPTVPDPEPVIRPIVVLDNYKFDTPTVTYGQTGNLMVRFHNAGRGMAFNVVASFVPGDFLPSNTGGVQAIKELDPGEDHRIYQPFIVGFDVLNKTNATLVLQISYSDEWGYNYTQTFNLTIPTTRGKPRTPTPTATPQPLTRPQLVITGYASSVLLLQPGTRFDLQIKVNNVGNAAASRISMIIGGGTSSNPNPSPRSTGTPEAGGGVGSGGSGATGGVSGGSGDFGTFAPVSASNIQYLGDLPVGKTLDLNATLIVNASANPGAYPLKISFTYIDANNVTFTDDQVVTLLVYSPPLVEVSFYRDPGTLLTGQPNMLPIQVVNLGRKSTVLGNMKVGGTGAQYSNNTTLIGNLDVGGYYTLDTQMTADQPGPLAVMVTINYTDDFNQPQVLTYTLDVEVQAAPEQNGIEGPGAPGSNYPPPVTEEETLVQKIIRFMRGLLGLDSAKPTPVPVLPIESPEGPTGPSAPGPKG